MTTPWTSREWRWFWGAAALHQGAAGVGRASAGEAGIVEVARHASKMLRLGPSDVLLDAGCGNGIVGQRLSGRIRRYVGLDFSIEQLAKFREHRPIADVVQADVMAPLPFRDGVFTAAILGGVLQYMNGSLLRFALAGLRRVCRPASRALLSGIPDVMHRDDYISGTAKIEDPAGRERSVKAARHATWYTPQDVLASAQRAGWSTATVVAPARVWQAWYQFDVLIEAPSQ